MRVTEPGSAVKPKPPAKKKPKPAPPVPVYAHTVSSAGLEFIARWEGCVLHPYNDPLNATIGVGHLIHMGTVTAADESRYRGFTHPQAISLLKVDAGKAVAAVNALGLHLAQHELDALVSFAFNCGAGALSGGVARNLHAGDKPAAMAVLSEFVHAGGPEPVLGLVRRRAGEVALFLHGSYGA